LQCSDNAIANWKELEKELAALPALRCVYFERCPIYDDHMYRKKMQLMLPKLQQIDATPVPKTVVPPPVTS